MKKWENLIIATTLVIFTGIGFVNTGFADTLNNTSTSTPATEPGKKKDTIERKVVVTAKSNQALEDMSVSTTLITAEEIQASNASSIKEVLMERAGIDLGVNSSSVSGRQTISIRGSSSNHVLILVDGKKVSGSDAQIGHSDFQYNWVPMNAIERIEVVKGPMSSIYGSQSIGGVINIITKSGEDNFYGDIGLKYGSSSDEGGDLKNASLNIGGKISSRLSLSVSAERTDLDAATDEDNKSLTKIEGKEITEGMAKVRFDIDETQSIEASYSQGTEDRYKINDTLYYDIERNNFALGYTKQFKMVHLDIDAYRVDSDSHYNTTGSTGGYTHNLTDSVARAEVSIAAFDHHYIVTGAEYKEEAYDKSYDKAASSYKNFQDELANTAAFIQDEIELGDAVLITLGSRYDYHEKFDGEWSPKLGALYKLGDHHRFKASYGQGFMAPTLTQNSSSYTSTSQHIYHGNDDLQPETSESFELGYEYFTDNTSFKAAIYKTEVTNLIDSTRIVDNITGPDEYMYVNVDNATMKGFEFELSHDLHPNHNIRIGYHYLETEDGSTGQELPYRPKHSVNARLSSILPLDIHATFSANYTGCQSNPAEDEEYDAFTRYNIQLSRTFYDRFTVRLGIDNITDEDLDAMPYDIKGRLAYVGVNYTF